MKKSSQELESNQFDVVIIGGGIHGATLALESSRAGYKVALLEKGDFGHCTSANSLKIIHGGIRYLQHGDFKRMRESIRSRRAMMRFSPHLVKPLACLMPTYGHGIKGREVMRLAFGVYDMVAFDRNKGLLPESHLPTGRTVSRAEVASVVPGIEETKLTGGAVWYDAIADNTERLILEYIKEAVRFGAVVANYTQALELESDGGRVSAVRAEDLHLKKQFTVSCRSVVNAAGPFLSQFCNGVEGCSGQSWSTAVNIVVKKKLFHTYAVGLEGYTDYTDKDAIIKRGKRLFFFVPWSDKYTMIGTTYKPYRGDIESFSLSRDDICEILDDVNKIYPKGNLTIGDVTLFHSGLLPMKSETSGDGDESGDGVQLDKSSTIIDHGQQGDVRGLYSIKGIKYTTAPDIAEKMLRLLGRDKRIGLPESGTYQVPRPVILDFSEAIRKLGDGYQAIRNHLLTRYGRNWRDVFKYLVLHNDKWDGEPSLWLTEDPPLLKCELHYFIGDEMAFSLADVVLRRSSLGTAECPAEQTLENVADFMARELGWTEKERREQVGEVRAVYGILKG